MSSWDSFKAFGGKLEPSLLRPPLDSNGKVDLQAAILSFSRWIEGLRHSPVDYGISQEKTKDVVKLLDTFFPEPARGQPLKPRRINSEQGTASYRKIVPVEVGFGPKNVPLSIVDAPNALGYIFSCAALPSSTSSSTFENYYLPHCACFAWFTYLAFLRPSSSPTAVITNVPLEVCLLYLPSSVPGLVSIPVFFLGATWSAADPADMYGAGMVENDENQMDRWRSENLIEPAFAMNSNAQAPEWTPNVRRTAARRLNEYILGKKGNDSDVRPFLDPLFSGVFSKLPGLGDKVGFGDYIQVVSALVMADSVQPLGKITKPDFLISHSKLSPQLMELLYVFVDAITNLVEPPKLLENLAELVRFYITPHVFDPVTQQELPLGQQSKSVVEPLAATLPALLLDDMMKKLHSLKCHLNHTNEKTDSKIQFIESDYFINDSRAYGRCPEAIPTCALSQKYFGDSLPVTQMSNIRGVKFSVRALGQAIMGGAFKDSFSKAHIDNASFQTIDGQSVQVPVVVPPSADSKVLLQQAQIRTDSSFVSYSEDAEAACPKTFRLFSS